MKKVVQFCAFNSIYNEKLREQLLKNTDFSRENQLEYIFLEDEMKSFINKQSIGEYNEFCLLKKVIFWIKFITLFQKERNYNKQRDIINVQFVDIRFVFFLSYFKRNFNKLVLSIWGSDLLRQTSIKLKLLKPLFNLADYITFETEEMKNLFLKINGQKYLSKCKIVKFGISVLEDINNIEEKGIISFKHRFEIDETKKVLVIGYNRIKQQQHLAVIESIIRENLDLSNICIVLPWTYGSIDKEYENELIKHLKGKVDYCFLYNRLSDFEVACLRCITDVFIQVQTTDSLSATMLETLYAKKTVITGKWLPYQELRDLGIVMEYVDNVDEIGNKIKELLSMPIEERDLCKNSDVVWKLSSWSENINNWINLYTEGAK